MLHLILKRSTASLLHRLHPPTRPHRRPAQVTTLLQPQDPQRATTMHRAALMEMKIMHSLPTKLLAIRLLQPPRIPVLLPIILRRTHRPPPRVPSSPILVHLRPRPDRRLTISLVIIPTRIWYSTRFLLSPPHYILHRTDSSIPSL